MTNLQKQTSADPINRPQKSRFRISVGFLVRFVGITCVYNYVLFGCSGVKEEDNSVEVEQKTETVKAEEREDKENKENIQKAHPKKNVKKETVGKSQKNGTSEDSGGVLVKGLSNLGNTCFFNAVIQVRLCVIGIGALR